MALTKTDMIESLSKRCGISKVKSDKLLEIILEMMKGTLESGEDVLISRFGKFSVRARSACSGRDPATGRNPTHETMRVVTFRCSPVLRAKVNGR